MSKARTLFQIFNEESVGLVNISIDKHPDQKIQLDLDVKCSIENLTATVKASITTKKAKIVKLDDQDEEIEYEVKVDASKANIYSEGAGAYGAFRGVKFRDGRLEFTATEAKGYVKDGVLYIDEVCLG